MIDLALRDGDWSFPGDGTGLLVEGSSLLLQGFKEWLTERLGIDSLHPEYGSRLWQMIGGRSRSYPLEEETRRVALEYVRHCQALYNLHPTWFQASEVPVRLLGVTADTQGEDGTVLVVVETLDGQTRSVTV
jgi:phage baseplate assembly protein W